MLTEQVLTLQATGKHLLELASKADRASEVEKLTTLGMKCLSEVRDILAQRKNNSILIFIECAVSLKKIPTDNYPAYVEFCARNAFETISETDFKSTCESIFLDKP